MIDFAVCFFFFEIFEKTFTAGVVKRISFLRKRLNNIERIQKLSESKSSVLSASVGMKHQPIGGISFFISFPKGSNNQIYIGIGRDVLGDHFSGVQVHYNAEAIPIFTGINISNVTGPYKIWGFLVKILLQMITAIGWELTRSLMS